jgi:transcription antitermination factor NusG
MRIWSDRKKIVELPLLNGYVFVNEESNKNDIILQTQGVVNFVRSEGKIAVIPEHEMNRLKQLVELGYQLESTAIERKYNEGDKIKINSGALKGIEGFVIEQKGNRYIEVLLDSIGRCIRVKLPQELLLPA